MVYSYRGSYGRGYVMRKASAKQKPAASSYLVAAANSALAIAKDNARHLNAEYKHYDKVLSFNLPLAATPGMTTLVDIAEGVDNDQRIGRSVRILSSYIFGRMYINSTTGGANAVGRMMVVRDKATNGTFPVPTTVIQATANALSPLNSDYFGNRYEVISSMCFDFCVGARQAFWVDEYRKVDKLATWSGSGSGVADAATGMLFLFTTSDVYSTSGTDRMVLDVVHRTVYIDN